MKRISTIILITFVIFLYSGNLPAAEERCHANVQSGISLSSLDGIWRATIMDSSLHLSVNVQAVIIGTENSAGEPWIEV